MDLLQSHHIDIRFIGEDYREKKFTGSELPIDIEYTSRKHSFSSSNLRERIFKKWVDKYRIICYIGNININF